MRQCNRILQALRLHNGEAAQALPDLYKRPVCYNATCFQYFTLKRKAHVADLKALTKELGIDFTVDENTSHLDYSPEGKRSALAQAHLKAREASGRYFG